MSGGKTVVLTGASGFVGRQILKALIANGHAVRAVTRPASAARMSDLSLETDVIYTEDMFDEARDWWSEKLSGADALIHAAWYVEPGRYQDSPENIRNAIGTLAMADGAMDAGVKHVIGIGTCMEYRLPSDTLTVASPLGPSTLYSAAKLATCFALRRRFAAAGARFSWARLFYLYGEGEHPGRLVPYIRRQLEQGEIAKLSAGTQLRDYLDVADAGKMIVSLIDTGQSGPVNICSGKAITIRALAEKIAAEYGRPDLLEFGTASLHPSDPVAVVGVPNLEGWKGA